MEMKEKNPNEKKKYVRGSFDGLGGRYVAEMLHPSLAQLEEAFEDAMNDPDFLQSLEDAGKQFIGRPTPLLPAESISSTFDAADIYIKLEGLANTGAHKINNALGQAILAKRMGKQRIIAETGAGQHGLAVAAACARLKLDCTIYMGELDWQRQHPNVFYMELFGAKVQIVRTGSRSLKDAVTRALQDWASSYPSTHYLIGSALGPSPYPDMVREFQSVIGRECKQQCMELGIEPTSIIAAAGGGSNAMGIFSSYLNDSHVRLIAAEAGGRGDDIGNHASRMGGTGKMGIVHGYKSLFLSDADGQVADTHSISAGLDYAGIGPELAALGLRKRVEFLAIRDAEALEALQLFAQHEGLLFALESAHAAAACLKFARRSTKKETIILHMSGRGDKDLFILARELRPEQWKEFLEEEGARL